MRKKFSHGSGQDMLNAFRNALRKDTQVESSTYIDTDGVFSEPGSKISYQEIRDYWDNNYDYDPSLQEYDSFENWWKDTKTLLKEDVNSCGAVFAASYDPYLDGIKSWVKDDEAAQIIFNWYSAEDAFEDFDNVDDFIDYVQDDIYDMLEAGSDGYEVKQVADALGIDMGYDDIEFSTSEVVHHDVFAESYSEVSMNDASSPYIEKLIDYCNSELESEDVFSAITWEELDKSLELTCVSDDQVLDFSIPKADLDMNDMEIDTSYICNSVRAALNGADDDDYPEDADEDDFDVDNFKDFLRRNKEHYERTGSPLK